MGFENLPEILGGSDDRDYIFYNTFAAPGIGTHVFYDTFEAQGIGTHVFYDTFEAPGIGTHVFYDTFVAPALYLEAPQTGLPGVPPSQAQKMVRL